MKNARYAVAPTHIGARTWTDLQGNCAPPHARAILIEIVPEIIKRSPLYWDKRIRLEAITRKILTTNPLRLASFSGLHVVWKH
jgi:hypothetical protein